MKVLRTLQNQFALSTAIVLFSGLANQAFATTVQFDVQNVAGSRWQVDYSISNDTLSQPIEQLTIFFPVDFASNLAITSGVSGWDALVVQPDPQLPDEGFLDVLATAGGLLVGASVSGFSVQFDYLVTGTPGSQRFEVVDPRSFAAIDSGFTQVVPLPPTLYALLTACCALVVRSRRGVLMFRRR